MIVGKNLFNQPTKNDLGTYDNIRKTITGQCDDYTTGCFIGYIYLKKHCTLIAINLIKKQKLDADPKAIQQINYIMKIVKFLEESDLLIKAVGETIRN